MIKYVGYLRSLTAGSGALMFAPKNNPVALALVFTLIALWVAPLAGSLSTGAHSGAEPHYCEVSKGPCKHGDACPIKHPGHHGKHKARHHDSHAAGAPHHHDNHSDNGTATHATAFTCHGSAGASAATIADVSTVLTPAYTLTADLSIGFEQVAAAADTIYIDTDQPPPHHPPRAA